MKDSPPYHTLMAAILLDPMTTNHASRLLLYVVIGNGPFLSRFPSLSGSLTPSLHWMDGFVRPTTFED